MREYISDAFAAVACWARPARRYRRYRRATAIFWLRWEIRAAPTGRLSRRSPMEWRSRRGTWVTASSVSKDQATATAASGPTRSTATPIVGLIFGPPTSSLSRARPAASISGAERPGRGGRPAAEPPSIHPRLIVALGRRLLGSRAAARTRHVVRGGRGGGLIGFFGHRRSCGCGIALGPGGSGRSAGARGAWRSLGRLFLVAPDSGGAHQ